MCATAIREVWRAVFQRLCVVGGGHTTETAMEAAGASTGGPPVIVDHPDDSGELGEDNVIHPWPYLQQMFLYIGMKDSSYRMKCLLCLPKVTEILAFKNSPSNLKKHIEVG